MEKSLFDQIYNYIIAIDNDCQTKEQQYEILEKFKTFYSRKIPEHHHLHKLVSLSANNLCERDTLKEICNNILLNMEEENIFNDDFSHSKEIYNYYKYIYLPSMDLQ